jgi:excinuclease UvrABC nuclease subunit
VPHHTSARPAQYTTTTPNVPTSVYRYYDRDGMLIYVGITSRGARRNYEHNRSKDWWPYVARQEVDHYETRDQALKRERSLIIRHRPPFNRQHNPDADALRAVYVAYADASEESALDAWRPPRSG